jgi:hypothetical protein
MARRWFRAFILLACFAPGTMVLALGAGANQVDFDRDIRPIFSDNCFACHGPDEAKRKSGLRLDRREDAFKAAKSGERAIVPGDVNKSEILARVTAANDDDHMPPPSTGKKLSPRQIDLLRTWIQNGAKWETHWAFVPPVRSAVPAVQDPSWSRNEIDRFVQARLEKEGLKPSPEADKATLIRRASLDLTGLPPTLEEVDAFLADGSPEAYDKVVDRLMSWQRFGEHQAQYWLDAVRYADTHGYHIDSRRDMWKYRDWVIQAINENKPFDQFTIDQLAGDLEPNPTLEQKIATGYVRANMTTGEGGVIEDEYRAKYTFDRVETTGAIYLGMTLMCARCHSHKYDPIQQREYYNLYAIFNQVADPVMDENKPNPDPYLKVPSPTQAERLDWLKTHVECGQRQLHAPIPRLDEDQIVWQRQWTTFLTSRWTVLKPSATTSLATNGPNLRVLQDNSILAAGSNPETDVHELTFSLRAGELGGLRLEVLPDESQPAKASGRAEDGSFSLSQIEADLVRAAPEGKTQSEHLRFERAVADAEAKDHEIGRALDAKKETGWQLTKEDAKSNHTAVFVLRSPIQVEPGAELKVRLRYEGSTNHAALAHFRIAVAQDRALLEYLFPPHLSPWQVVGPLKASDPGSALHTAYEPESLVDLKQKFPGVREEVGWTERTDLEDGKSNLLVQDLHGIHGVRYLYRTLTLPHSRTLEVAMRADGIFRLWLNGRLVAERDHEETPGEGPLKATLDLVAGHNKILLKIVTVQGASFFTFQPDLGSADGLTADIAAVLATSATMTAGNEQVVRTYFRRQRSVEFRRLDNNLVDWREEISALDRVIPTTLVAKESETYRDTFLLSRGDYDKKGDKVGPNVPSIFPPIPKGYPTNRLGLAKWLVDPSHPLTARVTVNRLWQQYFGVGLVKTAEDFGMQGEHPSNPELLDWLATEFIRSGWNVKHLHRLIVTSTTYRQSSHASPDLVARDPENRLLARGPRFRLEAEAVRDTALYLSGLLVEHTGGRSVRPYEPPGLWEAVSFNNSQRYVQDTGESEYRRSVYTFWKRQSPPPAMLIFDAPSREACMLRRSRANTPLQALALLNDPQFVEAARAFAERILKEGGSSMESRAQFAFRLATARRPKSDELAILRRFVEEELETFRHDPSAAEKICSSYGHTGDQDPAEVAAWTTLATLILNLDETITKS